MREGRVPPVLQAHSEILALSTLRVEPRGELAGFAGDGPSREGLETLPVPPPGRGPGSFKRETLVKLREKG